MDNNAVMGIDNTSKNLNRNGSWKIDKILAFVVISWK